MSRMFHLIALALATAAVAAPIAQAATDPSGNTVADPLAVSYLQGQGMSPGEIKVRVGQGDPLALSYVRSHGFPQAQATADATPAAAKAIDPLAVSYLQGQGMSPGEIKALTVGVDPLAVSYLREHGFTDAQIRALATGRTSPAPASPAIDPLAISYLRGLGMTQAQIDEWTTGVCAQAVRPAVCTLPLSEVGAAAAVPVASDGFSWGDAGIGAGATLGIVLLLAGLGVMLVTSRHGRRSVARA